ncbi:hypothetical protein FRC12_023561, partial [Ceratobasidium sp. 428]
MLPVTWLITGSSRGLGLEFVTQLVNNPNNVVLATCRNPDTAAGLKTLTAEGDGRVRGKLHVIPLDVADETSIMQASEVVGDILSRVGQIPGAAGLDYLIQNAAITLP